MYILCFFVCATNMADRILGFNPTEGISPDSPLHSRYLPRIAEDDPLVPTAIVWPPVKEKACEVDTGTPPTKYFKPPWSQPSQLFSQRWILLPPEEIANPDTRPHSYKNLSLPKATFKHNRNQTGTMPYNNTAIPPPEEITGAASLPC